MNFRLGHAAYLHYRLFCSNGGAILLIRPQTPRPPWSKFQFLSLFKVKLVTEKTRQTSGVFLFLILARFFFSTLNWQSPSWIHLPKNDTLIKIWCWYRNHKLLYSDHQRFLFSDICAVFVLLWWLYGAIFQISHTDTAQIPEKKNLLGLPNHISIT